MRILIFNWRDITHPWAGGAELNTQEQAKRWAAQGHKVTLVCGSYAGCKKHELIDGVHVVRVGGRFTLYPFAAWYYLTTCAFKYDFVIDVENGIPFFTPLFSLKPKLMIIHHVHGKEIFDKELSKFVSWLPNVMETYFMPWVYKHTQIIAVSETTRDGLLGIGVKPEQISIVHNGLNHALYLPGKNKTKVPSVLYLGRVMTYKRIDLLIRAVAEIQKTIPDVQLDIAGSGEDESRLKELAKQLNVNVTFHGFTSEEQKVKLMQQAWVFGMPSMKEGWGLTVLEANACGTPAVAFNVAGLNVAIKNNESGFLVETQEEFTQKILDLLKDKVTREKLSNGAVKWASKFSWDRTADETMEIIKEIS